MVFLLQIRKRVADGYRVLAHCFGGLGRAVLLAACFMLSLDQARQVDWKYLARVRRRKVVA